MCLVLGRADSRLLHYYLHPASFCFGLRKNCLRVEGSLKTIFYVGRKSPNEEVIINQNLVCKIDTYSTGYKKDLAREQAHGWGEHEPDQ